MQTLLFYQLYCRCLNLSWTIITELGDSSKQTWGHLHTHYESTPITILVSILNEDDETLTRAYQQE